MWIRYGNKLIPSFRLTVRTLPSQGDNNGSNPLRKANSRGIMKSYYETCWNCSGYGLETNMIGEPDTCHVCHGDTVVRRRNAKGQFSVVCEHVFDPYTYECVDCGIKLSDINKLG